MPQPPPYNQVKPASLGRKRKGRRRRRRRKKNFDFDPLLTCSKRNSDKSLKVPLI
jgi:hypothetical protein